MVPTGAGSDRTPSRCLPVVGAVAAVLVLGRIVAPADVEAFEWRQYLLLGTLFPLLVAVPLVARRAGAGRLAAAVEAGLALFGFSALVAFLVLVPSSVALALGAAHVALMWLVADRRARPALAALLVNWIVLAAAWNAVLRLVTYKALGPVPLERMLLRPLPDALVVVAVALCGFVWALRPDALAPTTRRQPLGVALALVPVVVASLRAGYLFNYTALYHWAVYIGPAELVRQGAWLLWDVPSQYGFLGILALAATPVASVWDAFFRLNVLFLVMSALLLLLHVRALGSSHLVLALGLAASMSAVFWVPGLPGTDGFSGVLVTPSGGPFRFIWWFALLTILRVAAGRWRAGRSLHGAMAAGTVAWLIGCLWSFESAVYCSATWLPAYALLVLTSTRMRPLLAVPAVVAAVALLVVFAVYRIRLGHGPDWLAFGEHASVFASGLTGITVDPGGRFESGAAGIAIDPRGPVWALVLAFVIVSGALVEAIDRRLGAGVVPVLGAWAGLWTIASYFVGRSGPLAVTNLLAVVCTVVLVAMQADGRAWHAALATPIFVAICALGLGNGRWSRADQWRLHGQYAWSVEDRRPAMDPADVALLAATDPKDPIVFCLDTLPDRIPGRELRAWLPTVPFPLFLAVPDGRRRLYLGRFVERARTSGWLAEPKVASYRPQLWHGWFPDQLRHTHEPGRSLENQRWRLTWYAYRAAPSR